MSTWQPSMAVEMVSAIELTKSLGGSWCSVGSKTNSSWIEHGSSLIRLNVISMYDFKRLLSKDSVVRVRWLISSGVAVSSNPLKAADNVSFMAAIA